MSTNAAFIRDKKVMQYIIYTWIFFVVDRACFYPSRIVYETKLQWMDPFFLFDALIWAVTTWNVVSNLWFSKRIDSGIWKTGCLIYSRQKVNARVWKNLCLNVKFCQVNSTLIHYTKWRSQRRDQFKHVKDWNRDVIHNFRKVLIHWLHYTCTVYM